MKNYLHLVGIMILALLFQTPQATARPLPDHQTALENRFHDLCKQTSFSEGDKSFVIAFAMHHSNDSAAHALLSAILVQSGFTGLACEEAERAWSLNPDSMQLLVAAIKLRLNNRFEKEAFHLALNGAVHFQNDYVRLSSLALLMQVENQHEAALTIVTMAEKLRTGAMDICKIKVNSLLALHRYNEARLPAAILASYTGTRTQGLLAQASIQEHAGEHQTALNSLRTAFSLSPTDPEVCKRYFAALSKANLHAAALEPGLVAMAANAGYLESKQIKLTIVSQLGPGDVARLTTTCNAVAGRLADLKQLSALYFLVGDICDKLQATDRAIAFYRLGIAVDPLYGRARMRLARDLEKAGTPSTAVSTLYAEAATLCPSDKEVRQALQRNTDRVKLESKNIGGRVKDLFRNLSCAANVS